MLATSATPGTVSRAYRRCQSCKLRRSARLCLPLLSTMAYSYTQPAPVASEPIDTLEEWRSSDRRKYYHPDDWERLISETQSKFLSGIPHEYEARFLRRDGKYRWFLFRWNPLRDEQGRVTRWYAAATDIEDRKQAEQRLQNENVALREEIDKASMFEEIVGIS